jgi:hypothetical protein
MLYIHRSALGLNAYLYDDWDAMQRAAKLAIFPFVVESLCGLGQVWGNADDGA